MQRLIDCNFLNASSFSHRLTNKAKLLYFFMLANGDAKGFVDNCNNLIDILNNNDLENGVESLKLLKNDYDSALIEIITSGLAYEFTNKHGDRVYLIRHWFIHNKWKSGLKTNYGKYYALVEIVNGEYVLKKKSDIKEKQLQNINNTNEIKTLQVKGDKMTDDEWNALLDELQEMENDNNND